MPSAANVDIICVENRIAIEDMHLMIATHIGGRTVAVLVKSARAMLAENAG